MVERDTGRVRVSQHLVWTTRCHPYPPMSSNITAANVNAGKHNMLSHASNPACCDVQRAACALHTQCTHVTARLSSVH